MSTDDPVVQFIDTEAQEQPVTTTTFNSVSSHPAPMLTSSSSCRVVTTSSPASALIHPMTNFSAPDGPSLSQPTVSTSMAVALNPNAALFQPAQDNMTQQRKKKTAANSNYSPEKAEIESLKIELSFTKTKIAELEVQLKDKEQSIKIYLQKIKILESERVNRLGEQYFTESSSSKTSSCRKQDSCPCLPKDPLIETNHYLKSIDSKLDNITRILGQPHAVASLSNQGSLPNNVHREAPSCSTSPPSKSRNTNLHRETLGTPATTASVMSQIRPPEKTLTFQNNNSNNMIQDSDSCSESDFEFSSPSNMPIESPRLSLN